MTQLIPVDFLPQNQQLVFEQLKNLISLFQWKKHLIRVEDVAAK